MFLSALTTIAALGLTGASTSVPVADNADPAAPAPAPPRPRLLPGAAAIAPGLLLHGAGHFVAGERKTAWRLFAAEAVSLAAIVGGLAGLALTGAAPETVSPFITLVAGGTSLFAASALADVYGVLAPAGGFGQPAPLPPLLIEAGPYLVRDRVFPYDAFSYLAAATWLARWRLQAQTWIGLDHDNQRFRATGAYRFARWGTTSFLDGELGAVHHRFAPEGFSTSFGEASIAGRFGLERVGRTLAGSFVDFGLGYALGMNHQHGISSESDEMLLLRSAFGIYLGAGGEAQVYYDHRHDGFAAGLKVRGLGSGPAGHFGARVFAYFLESWGAGITVEAGSAHVLGLSVIYRRAGTPR